MVITEIDGGSFRIRGLSSDIPPTSRFEFMIARNSMPHLGSKPHPDRHDF
jgi:hypothetical protein